VRRRRLERDRSGPASTIASSVTIVARQYATRPASTLLVELRSPIAEAIQETRALAERLHLRAAPSAASAGLRKEADDVTSRLENMPASNFDRAYVERTIRFHQKVLTAIDDAAARTDGPEVQALFGELRVRVESELAATRSVLASL
jgi:uncharacterized protein (DUF305 family)